jgi:beta-galactosidase
MNAFAGRFGLAEKAPNGARHRVPVADQGPSVRSGSAVVPWNGYMLGTAYYPEWWEPQEWETDFKQMQALGLNTVRMGEFAWASFEPAPGKFEFGWMDQAIDAANRHGIKVILATPTAAVPPWLYQLHPDVLGASALGPFTYGGRKGYCTNSANYLDASARITKALAEHYGSHASVIGWQLDNEPGIPFECLDQNCEHGFQVWLQKRYGSLDELNRVWNGAFWSNTFTDWSQIRFPKNSGEGGWQPAITLNYRRFFSDSYLNHLRRQSVILKEITRGQFIFTNWPTATWSVNTFEAGADFLDATAWDNYCSAPGLTEFQHQYISSMQNDFSRCAGPNQRFLCAEQIAYLPPNALPQALRLQAYQNLAHGSHGHLYFEWRRPLAGGEQQRPSFIKGFDGEINPAKPIFQQIGVEFARIGPQLANATTRSDIALIYDFTNEWAQGFWSVGDRNDHYDSEAGRYYGGFKVLQRNIDFIPVIRDFTPYKLLVAPNLRLIDDATVKRITQFVVGGGTIVLTYRAATQNPDGSMRRAIPPGPFAEIAGLVAKSKLDLVEYSSERGQLNESLRSELGISFEGSEAVFQPRTIMEALTLQGATPIATFRGGRMAGKPAITRHKYGQGWVFYVGTDSGKREFHEALARIVGETVRLKALINAPYGVEVSSREDDKATYYFLLNLTETPHKRVSLPAAMDNVLNGERAVEVVDLGPLEVAILAVSKT